MSLYEQNRHAWDRMARGGHPLAKPATEEDLRDPLKCVDEIGWLGGNIQGKYVLCLAAGGGRHSALYCAAGAHVTVVDMSPGMLELDRQVAYERRLDVRLIEANMTRLSMLRDAEFDIVIQPVSTCYVDDLQAVYREVARVLRPGGLYISQHKQPANLQASLEPNALGKYALDVPCLEGQLAIPPLAPSRLRESGAREVIHTLQALLGGMCRAGFCIEDLTEPQHARLDESPGTFGHRCGFLPPYLRVKARRQGNPEASARGGSGIWTGESPVR